jgi:hypothetical protein
LRYPYSWAGYGWTLAIDEHDNLVRIELPGSHGAKWSTVPEDFREECRAHTAELRAHVLRPAG